jgi:hypothetical protein
VTFFSTLKAKKERVSAAAGVGEVSAADRVGEVSAADGVGEVSAAEEECFH